MIALLLAVVVVSPAEISAEHVKVRLVPEQTAIQPGGALGVGLHMRLDPDWHVYWKNPGDSGEPPKIKWTLPEGWSAEPLEFPRPHRLQTGPIVNYVYEGEAFFHAQVRAPASAAVGETVTLSARLSWLVCKEDCIPGFATVTLSVPVRADAKLGPEAARFGDARAARPASLETTYTLADDAALIGVLGIESARAPIQFFGAVPGEISTKPTRVFSTGVDLLEVKLGPTAQPGMPIRGLMLVGETVLDVTATWSSPDVGPPWTAPAPIEAAAADPADPGWSPWSPERQRALLAEGTPVFVHFTATWCTPCKVVEREVFATDPGRAAFTKRGVAHLVADWTDQDPQVSAVLDGLGQTGIPFYVLYRAGQQPVTHTGIKSLADLEAMLEAP